MGIVFGSARIDENGNISGGAAGDQTGKEVATQSYYMHSQGWYCLRPKSESQAAAIATAMSQACANNNIGYDQNQRNTCWTQLKAKGSLAKITTKCETDCSALVRCCIYQATGKDVGDMNTSSLAATLEKSGLFNSRFSVTGESQLYNGDVLVTKTKGHTVIVVSGRARRNSSNSSSSSSNSSSSTSSSSSTGLSKGVKPMQCMFKIDGKDTVYYFNGIDKIVSLGHVDEMNILKTIYKDNNGKDMPFYNWKSSAPWYNRLLSAINRSAKKKF